MEDSNETGFTRDELLDVKQTVNRIIQLSQPHTVTVEGLLKWMLLGTVITNEDGITGTVVNVTVFPSEKDSTALRLVCTIVNEHKEPKMVWLLENKFYRDVGSSPFNLKIVSRSDMEDYLEELGIENYSSSDDDDNDDVDIGLDL